MKHYKLDRDINIDLAWEKLYSRIREEGLTEKQKTAEKSRQWLMVAAAIVALCTGTVSLLMLNNGKTNDGNIYEMSASNEKNVATLVATLEDGSIAYLGENTQLEYPAHFPSDKRMVRLKGKALFEISGNRLRPFLIETEKMIIEVTGTTFDVECSNNTVAVKNGEVKVTLRKNSQTLNILKGQTAAIISNKLELKQTIDPERFSRYTEMLRFKGEKLNNILQVINNRGGNVILKSTQELENRQITVTFAGNEPAQDIAEIICNAFDLKLNIDNNIMTISNR